MVDEKLKTEEELEASVNSNEVEIDEEMVEEVTEAIESGDFDVAEFLAVSSAEMSIK